MTAPRYFVLSGGASPADLLDRVGKHGVAGRAVAHAAPSRMGVYGAVEIKPSKAEGRGDVAQAPLSPLTPVRDMPAWQEGDSSASPPNGLTGGAP